VGCGAQGLNQGLNMRDSGLDISYALRADAIATKRQSFVNADGNGFTVGTYEVYLKQCYLVKGPHSKPIRTLLKLYSTVSIHVRPNVGADPFR
jgi:hypothetical protein